MSVLSNQFYELNPLRPADAAYGEVTCIELHVTDWSGRVDFLGYSKRKSIHVPPSSNAYWNWMCLRADLTRYCSERGFHRGLRSSLYAALNDGVRNIHRISCIDAYTGGYEASQYFDLNLSISAEVLGMPTVKSVAKTQDIQLSDIGEVIYSANFLV